MEPREFCYWLQGFAENNANTPDEMQWSIIRDRLGKVFNKVTKSSVDDDDPFSDLFREDDDGDDTDGLGDVLIC